MADIPVEADVNRLIKEGASVEKYEWVQSEFRGAVFALEKGMEWGLIDPEALDVLLSS